MSWTAFCVSIPLSSTRACSQFLRARVHNFVSLLSPPAQLAQAVVVDAEVMGHLVHDGNPYLAA